MATLNCGKYAGRTVTLHQFCNNWFSVEGDDFTRVVGPTALRLTPEEVATVLQASAEGRTGIMFNVYDLDPTTGVFSRRNPGTLASRSKRA